MRSYSTRRLSAPATPSGRSRLSPIISLNLGGQPVVVLNSYQVASDLLDNRSAIYSDRPRFIMGSEILTGSMLIAFMTYGDPWKKLRRAAHDGLTRQVSASYTPIQEREASILVKSMIEQPSLWDQNLRRKAFFAINFHLLIVASRSAASGLLGIVYGLPSLDSTDDPLITRVDDFIRRLVRATLPGAFLVEIFPVMKRLPSWMAKGKKEGLEWHRKETILFQGIMNDAKDLAVAAALCVFILAMTLYPNVMRTAQSELDQVVGRDRMPSFSDRANLPYIEAIVKEDDRYNGYFIPKGTLVLYNYAYRDPEIFPDYDEFRPERYLEQPDLEYVTYGFGRRIWMGKDVANDALFINIASMLSALDFAAPIDDSGNKILPSRTACVDKGLVVRPVPFECCITPRQFPVSTSSKV
ncbi:cytochrome P450 [Mycena olivaceomarginata]|nr:cytochrome P450 [Mycena olivaceomarginata]